MDFGDPGASASEDFGDMDHSAPPVYLVVRSSARHHNRELRGIHFLPADDSRWTQAIAFLGAGGLEFAFLYDLDAARLFLGDPLSVPIVENSPLVPSPGSTADRSLWPIFQRGAAESNPDPAASFLLLINTFQPLDLEPMDEALNRLAGLLQDYSLLPSAFQFTEERLIYKYLRVAGLYTAMVPLVRIIRNSIANGDRPSRRRTCNNVELELRAEFHRLG